jgi:hypothetical protein
MSIFAYAGWRAARRRSLVLAAATFVGAVPLARLGAQSKALTLAEVIDLRRNGVSSRQILRNAREYCIAFALSDSVRRELSVAGADTTLVGGLVDVCSTHRPAKPAIPPLIDDVFARTTASQAFAWNDRRCKARFEAGGIRLENQSADALCMMRYPSAELSSSVRVELTVAQLGAVPTSVAMLGFGRSGNASNHYAVSVAANGRVELCWNADRLCSPLVQRNGVAALHLGPTDENQIAVEIRDREITVLVNGVATATYTADGPVVGRLSLGVGPRTSLVALRLHAVTLP